MKKKLIIIFSFVFITTQSLAVTLYEALNETYNNNKQLNAERENIKASEENLNISKADYMPSLSLSGSKSLEETNKLTNQSGGDASISDSDPFTTSIKLEQTLLDFGRDLNYEKNLVSLELSNAKLFKKEQDLICC
ncbi:TolC family protein [Candidatus Pelagibacter sp.]|nr:TolC family protein [Candidatus Pelagibacter sp.]